jgi:hypothetical protein
MLSGDWHIWHHHRIMLSAYILHVNHAKKWAINCLIIKTTYMSYLVACVLHKFHMSITSDSLVNQIIKL